MANFRNGARSPPRPMTLVLRDNASTNVTLQPGDGIEAASRKRSHDAGDGGSDKKAHKHTKEEREAKRRRKAERATARVAAQAAA